jgi:uncharacterized protein
MTLSGSLPMTRRCFFVAAGLGLAAGTAGAAEPVAATADLPGAELLSDGDVKTYLVVFHTGQEVMQGLLAFARKHKLVAGHLTGIGAVSDAVIGYFDPEKKTYLRNHEKGQVEVLSLTGNLALDDDEPFFHVHVALGLRDGGAGVDHVPQGRPAEDRPRDWFALARPLTGKGASHGGPGPRRGRVPAAGAGHQELYESTMKYDGDLGHGRHGLPLPKETPL